MKCKHCQKEIEDSATVCPYCKTPVIRITPKKVCGYCYTELKKGDKTCKGCGRKIPEELLKLWAKEAKSSQNSQEQEENKEYREDSLDKQNPSEKREILLFSKKGREEKPSAPDQEFLCLMLSICPPLAAVIFRLLFSSTGFLPWQITILFVYCLSSMALAYFLEEALPSVGKRRRGRHWEKATGACFIFAPRLPFTSF